MFKNVTIKGEFNINMLNGNKTLLKKNNIPTLIPCSTFS